MIITSKSKSESLQKSLSNLKEKSLDFKQVANELFQYSYEDFNSVFKIDQKVVPPNSYKRVPIFSNNNCCALLMIWGTNNQTAIHDHLNYDGVIKVLKGTLSEISYSETADFIEYEKEGEAHEEDIFPEDLGGIHSIINRSGELSVSFHVYHTPQTSLQGVRIFDLENKKVAYLSDKATSCSWDLPSDNYEKIIQIN